MSAFTASGAISGIPKFGDRDIWRLISPDGKEMDLMEQKFSLNRSNQDFDAISLEGIVLRPNRFSEQEKPEHPTKGADVRQRIMEDVMKSTELAGNAWCDACNSSHPVPRDAAHHAQLQCFAPPPAA